MSWYTEEEIEKLLEDEELRKRIARFVTMSGEEFFDEVYTHLSPEELEEYLEENPSERKYLKRSEPYKTITAQRRKVCQMTNLPSSGSSSK